MVLFFFIQNLLTYKFLTNLAILIKHIKAYMGKINVIKQGGDKMLKKILKYFSIITAPIAILALIAYFSVLRMPEKIYVNDSTEVADMSMYSQGVFNTAKLSKDKINIDFL